MFRGDMALVPGINAGRNFGTLRRIGNFEPIRLYEKRSGQSIAVHRNGCATMRKNGNDAVSSGGGSSAAFVFGHPLRGEVDVIHSGST